MPASGGIVAPKEGTIMCGGLPSREQRLMLGRPMSLYGGETARLGYARSE